MPALVAAAWLCLSTFPGNASAGTQLIVNFTADSDPTTRSSIGNKDSDNTQTVIEARRIERKQRTLNDLQNNLGLNAEWVRSMTGNAAVVRIDSQANLQILRQELSALEYVESVDLDAMVWPAAIPDDARYIDQWQMGTSFAGSIDVEGAWDYVNGAASTVIAIIDTGVRLEHPDLQGRLLPGYDFVSGMNLNIEGDIPIPEEHRWLRANDGDGRDPDPSDPGDGVDFDTTIEMDRYGVHCPSAASTWHGTSVASVVAANSNDGIGIAGVTQNTQLLPIRAMGACGGRRSDLLDAIRWAAGVGDPSIMENLYPADIINLSLGVDDECTLSDQRAINDAIAAGSIVVAAVGNGSRNTDVNPTSPSQCENVVGVLATEQNGDRTSYSSYGQYVDIAAPGGLEANNPFGILVASNGGVMAPSTEQTYRQVTGTSIAAPHISGVLALMQASNPSLSNHELTGLLYSSSRPHHSIEGTTCDSTTCGWGLVNAKQAVVAAMEFTKGDALPIPELSPALDGTISRENRSFACSASIMTRHSASSYVSADFILLFCTALFFRIRRKSQAHTG